MLLVMFFESQNFELLKVESNINFGWDYCDPVIRIFITFCVDTTCRATEFHSRPQQLNREISTAMMANLTPSTVSQTGDNVLLNYSKGFNQWVLV